MSAPEARQLLDSIESNTLIGLRDRALIGLMAYSFARVGAAVTMRGADLFQHREQLWLRLHEKGGKRHEVPCHPELEIHLAAWTKAAGIGRDKKEPLFRSIGKGERLSQKAMSRFDVIPHDQAQGQSCRPSLFDLLPHLPCHWHYYRP